MFSTLIAAIALITIVAASVYGFGRKDFVNGDDSWQARVYDRFLASDAADDEREWKAAVRHYRGMDSHNVADYHAAMERLARAYSTLTR